MSDSNADWTERETALFYSFKTIDALRFDGLYPDPITVQFRLELDQQGNSFNPFYAGPFTLLHYQPHVPQQESKRSNVTRFVVSPAWYFGKKMKTLFDSANYNGWSPMDNGELFYGDSLAYLKPLNATTATSVWFSSIQAAHLEDPGVIQFTILDQAHQEKYYRLVTDWAELIFMTWACEYMPHHEQLASLGWIPADFEEKLKARGWYEMSGLPRLKHNFARGVVSPERIDAQWVESPELPSADPSAGAWDESTQSWR